MRKLRSVFLVHIPMLLLWGACDGLEPSAGGHPEPPPSPEPVNPGRPVHVTGTSFSLYIHFDGKIVDSTIPHYDWISDFCYTPGYENLVITFENQHFSGYPAGVYYTDSTTGEIVFYKRILGDMMDFQTTVDGKYAFTYRRMYSASGDCSHSQIYVFDMPYLLSHCRL